MRSDPQECAAEIASHFQIQITCRFSFSTNFSHIIFTRNCNLRSKIIVLFIEMYLNKTQVKSGFFRLCKSISMLKGKWNE